MTPFWEITSRIILILLMAGIFWTIVAVLITEWKIYQTIHDAKKGISPLSLHRR